MMWCAALLVVFVRCCRLQICPRVACMHVMLCYVMLCYVNQAAWLVSGALGQLPKLQNHYPQVMCMSGCNRGLLMPHDLLNICNCTRVHLDHSELTTVQTVYHGIKAGPLRWITRSCLFLS